MTNCRYDQLEAAVHSGPVFQKLFQKLFHINTTNKSHIWNGIRGNPKEGLM